MTDSFIIDDDGEPGEIVAAPTHDFDGAIRVTTLPPDERVVEVVGDTDAPGVHPVYSTDYENRKFFICPGCPDGWCVIEGVECVPEDPREL